MPFYEYECSKCRYYVEVLQKISDPPLKKCPSCGKSALRKLVSAPVFRLKGSGWYETDFKSDQEGRRNLAGADKDAPAAAADSKEAGKDAPKDTGKAGKDGAGEGAKSAAAEGSAESGKVAAGEKSATPAPRRSATGTRRASRAKGTAKRARPKPAPRKPGKPKRRGGR
jgi:putative FmdB family regulatory protein